jgi:hypothetical protein
MLFNSAVSTADVDGIQCMFKAQRRRADKDFEANDHGAFEDVIPACISSDRGNPRRAKLRIAGARAESHRSDI